MTKPGLKGWIVQDWGCQQTGLVPLEIDTRPSRGPWVESSSGASLRTGPTGKLFALALRNIPDPPPLGGMSFGLTGCLACEKSYESDRPSSKTFNTCETLCNHSSVGGTSTSS